MRLSIVTTMYASAPYLREFYDRASAAARRLTADYEIIFVNDGSPDDSLRRAVELYQDDAHVRVVDLSRNFGHHKAMMTGLSHARGDVVLLIDCDLEEAPELLEPFHARLAETGADVVYGVRRERRIGFFDTLASGMFYRVFNWLSDDPIPKNLVTARLMTSRYVRALTSFRERQTQIAGLWVITGFEQVEMPIDKLQRGSTAYTLAHKIAHLVNAVTSFSDKPLIVIFYGGAVITALSMAGAVYLIGRRMLIGPMLSGWPSLMVAIAFFGGLTIFCLGVIGIYVSRVFIETKQRPYTIVRQVYERQG